MDSRRRDVLKLATLVPLAHCAPAAPATPALAQARAADWRMDMQTRSLMTLRLSTASTQNLGGGPHGTRVTFPITGGSFEGERLRGVVLPGGGDWTLLRTDGVVELDLRVTLQTDDGALIHMSFEGLRVDAAKPSPYFRTLPRFDTASPKYAFLNRLLAVGFGEVGAGEPTHRIEELL